jgi:signal-transduction protein with cAMP-binding, CBS, and nucleotidyltransferase domain
MKNHIQQIDLSDLETITDVFGIMTFSNDFDLVYEKQIPNTGIILLQGELSLTKKKSSLIVVTPGSLLGLQNMLNGIPINFKCSVKKDTSVILLPKSEIMKILKKKNSPLYKILFDCSYKQLAS